MSFGGTIKLQGASEYQATLKSITNNLKVVASEMKVVTSSFDRNSASENDLIKQNEVLSKKLGLQKNAVKELDTALEAAKKEYGENSDEVKTLSMKLNNAQADVNKTERAIDKNNKTMDEMKRTGAQNVGELKKFGNAAENAGEKTSRLGDIIKGSLIADAIRSGISRLASGLKDLATSGIEYNAKVEQLSTSFEVMTGSAKEAAAITKRLQEIGASTPYEFTGLADTTQLLMQFGFTADDAIKSMQMLGDIAQGDSEKMGSVARALGKMSSAGKVSLEDINMMIDAGFNPLQEISERTGTSMKDLYAKISSGTMSVDEITDSMKRSTSEGGKFYKSMEKQSKTVAGQLSTLQDNWDNMRGSIMKDASGELAKSILPLLNNEIIPAIQASLPAVEKTVGAAFTAIKTAVQFIMNHKNAILAVLAGISAGFAAFKIGGLIMSLVAGFKSLTTAGITLNAVMAANPLGMVALAIGAAVAAGVALYINWDKIKETAGKLFSGIKGIFTKIKNAVVNAFKAIVNFLKQILPTFSPLGVGMFTMLYNGIKAVAPKVLDYVKKFGASIIKKLTGAVKTIGAVGKNIVSWLWDGIKSKTSGFFSNVLNVGKNAVNKIKSGVSAIGSVGRGFIDGLKNGISDKTGGLFDKVRSIGTTVVDKIKSAITGMASIGRDIVSGIWNGIADKWSWMLDKIAGFGASITNKVKKVLGIHSPSRVMRDEVGKYLAQGIGVGFEEEMGSVEEQMTKVIPTTFETTATTKATYNRATANQTRQQALREEKLDKLYAVVATYLPQVASMDIVTDTGALVGQLAPKMDTELGRIKRLNR